jgi:uncharacterized protein
MEFGLIDHAFIALCAFALPIYASIVVYPRHLQALREARPDYRLRMYRRTIVVQWIVAGLALGLWMYAGRPLSEIGLGMPGGPDLLRFTIATLLVAALVLLLHRQLRFAREDVEIRDRLREQFERTAPFAPRNARHMKWFAGVSVTAGICEELLMRGYLMAYIDHYFGLAAAVIVSSLVFGLGHLYQGAAGVLKTTIAGLVVAGLYVLSGSLWLPMLLHAFVDLNAGFLSRAVHEDEEDEEDEPE